MTVPDQPKIYHIVHVDRLPSIIADGCLWCDAEIIRVPKSGTTIGMSEIKQRRLQLPLSSHPDLHVGDCVPFYFCSRSIMLYLLYRGNHPELNYTDGQDPIIHMEADLYATADWARRNGRRWAFTLSNAGAVYFEDRCNLGQLNEINWNAVHSNQWSGMGVSPSIKEGKQAEFLLEHCFPWSLVDRIGVNSKAIYRKVIDALSTNSRRPKIEIMRDWYY